MYYSVHVSLECARQQRRIAIPGQLDKSMGEHFCCRTLITSRSADRTRVLGVLLSHEQGVGYGLVWFVYCLLIEGSADMLVNRPFRYAQQTLTEYHRRVTRNADCKKLWPTYRNCDSPTATCRRWAKIHTQIHLHAFSHAQSLADALYYNDEQKLKQAPPTL